MSSEANAHYDEAYFAWQRTVGTFGGVANAIKFADFIKPGDTVVDFGAGGGFLLAQLKCARKTGVEINPVGRASGASLGVEMVESLAQIPDNYADVVVSNHALEHTDFPLQHLRDILPKLKPGGLAVFVIPCEQAAYGWKANDINFHIYSWGPMCLGNLFTRAGFEIVESKAFFHKWPPYYRAIQKLFGWDVFHALSRVYSHLARRYIQVRCVARKPV